MELWQYQGPNCVTNPTLVGDIPPSTTNFTRIGLVAHAPDSSGYSFRIKNGAVVSNCVSGEASNLSATFASAANLLVGSSAAPNAPYVVRIGQDSACPETVTPSDYLSPNQMSLANNLPLDLFSYIQITDKDDRSSCHRRWIVNEPIKPDPVTLSGSSSKTLTWNDLSGATSYKVIRFSKASCAGPGTQLTELPYGTTTYTDNSPPSSASYIVTVQLSTGHRYFSACR
jgi:hypothetical protein